MQLNTWCKSLDGSRSQIDLKRIYWIESLKCQTSLFKMAKLSHCLLFGKDLLSTFARGQTTCIKQFYVTLNRFLCVHPTTYTDCWCLSGVLHPCLELWKQTGPRGQKVALCPDEIGNSARICASTSFASAWKTALSTFLCSEPPFVIGHLVYVLMWYAQYSLKYTQAFQTECQVWFKSENQ